MPICKNKRRNNSIYQCEFGLWFAHKHKILPTKFREGQVEYFGKRSMIIFRFMLVQCLIKTSKISQQLDCHTISIMLWLTSIHGKPMYMAFAHYML